jgi:hypothetical protein
MRLLHASQACSLQRHVKVNFRLNLVLLLTRGSGLGKQFSGLEFHPCVCVCVFQIRVLRRVHAMQREVRREQMPRSMPRDRGACVGVAHKFFCTFCSFAKRIGFLLIIF